MKSNKSAFTLVEVLVSIALIGILFSITTNVFFKNKHNQKAEAMQKMHGILEVELNRAILIHKHSNEKKEVPWDENKSIQIEIRSQIDGIQNCLMLIGYTLYGDSLTSIHQCYYSAVE